MESLETARRRDQAGSLVHRADLRGNGLHAAVVGGAPDDVAAAEAGAPDSDPGRIGMRFAFDEGDRRVDVLLLVERVDELADGLRLDGHVAVLVRFRHLAADDQAGIALPPAAVVEGENQVAGGGEARRDAPVQVGFRAAPAVTEHDRRQLLPFGRRFRVEDVTGQTSAVAPDLDRLAHEGRIALDIHEFPGAKRRRRGQRRDHDSRQGQPEPIPLRRLQLHRRSSASMFPCACTDATGVRQILSPRSE